MFRQIRSDVEQSDSNINCPFQKYTITIPNMGNTDTNEPPLSQNMLKDMFGEDAVTELKSSDGLALYKTQTENINETLSVKHQVTYLPTKTLVSNLFQFRNLPRSFCRFLVLIKLLLIKKHGCHATFGLSQSLFS